MSNYLKYLERYEEEENEVIFYLKDFPSSRTAGNKITRELYIFLFHDETLQLNRVHKIDDLIYKVETEQKYLCLNCQNPIFFEEASNYITTCDFCNWRNELNDTPATTPIILKSKDSEDYSIQICYPLIEEKDLEELPEGLREAVETYFKEPSNFTKEHYQNIYHALFEKSTSRLEAFAKKYKNKAKLAHFFQNSNFK